MVSYRDELDGTEESPACYGGWGALSPSSLEDSPTFDWTQGFDDSSSNHEESSNQIWKRNDETQQSQSVIGDESAALKREPTRMTSIQNFDDLDSSSQEILYSHQQRDEQASCSREDIGETDQCLQHDEEIYHELFFQPHRHEFLAPVFFEDGMDFSECEQYYEARGENAKTCSPSPRSVLNWEATAEGQEKSPLWLGHLDEDDQSLDEPLKPSPHSPLNDGSSSHSSQHSFAPMVYPNSCLRSPKRGRLAASKLAPPYESVLFDLSLSDRSTEPETALSEVDASPRVAIRRCSFSGMPAGLDEGPPLTTKKLRSRSWDGDFLLDRRVTFESHVMVVTIPTVLDYPHDMREQLWMSRNERPSRRGVRKCGIL